MSKKKTKLEKFKENGLIGCLNDTGITSENYKNMFIMECNCSNNDLQIDFGEMFIMDCEGIIRRYEINYCPLCGKKFY